MTGSKLKNYPSIAQSFGITGIASLAILLVGIAAPLLTNLAGVEAGQLLFEILAMGIPLLIVLRLRNKKAGYLPINLSLKNKRILPYLVLASIALLIGIINPLSSLIPMPESLKQEFLTLASQTGVFTFITLVIAAPILEELIFRGIILDGLLKRYSPTKSILISSLLFGLVHLNPWQFVTGFVLGIFIGWVYNNTKSLTTSIIIHASFNLTAYLLRMSLDMEKLINSTLVELYGGIINLITAIIGSLLIVLICVYFLKKEFKKGELVS